MQNLDKVVPHMIDEFTVEGDGSRLLNGVGFMQGDIFDVSTMVR